ncbi:MAG: alpha/beta fold hydrolase [Gammaproteobacteria bacterium]
MYSLALALGALVATIAIIEFAFPATSARLALSLERRRSGLRLKEKTVGDVTVRYLEGGQGDSLVLLHGFGADKDNYTRVAGALTKHFHVIAPDLPGFGDSTRLPDAPYPFVDQTHRLHELLQGMGLTRYHIAGSSMGCAMAALYGALYPDHTMSRWLLAPAGVEGCDDSVMAAEYRATGKSLLLPSSVKDFERVMNLATEKPLWLPPSVKRLLGERAMADSILHARVFEEIALSPPINDLMRDSTVPTLIVWGDKDRVLDVSGAEILRDALPNATLIVMPGIGHLPMVEAPKQAAQDFIEFTTGL